MNTPSASKDNTTLYIVIAVVVALLICCCCSSSIGGLYYEYGTGTSGALQCGSTAANNAAQQYYNTSGPYKGQYTMTPIGAVQRDANTCDIKYSFAPVPGNPAITGPTIDWRTFTYTLNPLTTTDMGAVNSGTLAQNL